ncbi:hypothetical protein [Pseudarthrobacter sp. CCNWLW207]|uniref:hypothetical protein n=1 Tax=Pseudarthrobacter sp. CCNWLW207 TaxID=3127468 RepID=UPI003078A1E5
MLFLPVAAVIFVSRPPDPFTVLRAPSQWCGIGLIVIANAGALLFPGRSSSSRFD